MSESLSRIPSERTFIQQHSTEDASKAGAMQAPIKDAGTQTVNTGLVIDTIQPLSTSGLQAKSAAVLPPDSASYFSHLNANLDHLDHAITQAQASLNDPQFANNLNTLNKEDHATLSHALNTADDYVGLSRSQGFTQKMAIGMSEILQLVNQMRRLMGESYHNDMQQQRSNMMKQYDAKIEHMYEAAKADFSAGLARGIGGIGAGAIGAIPVVGAAGQISSGTGDTVGAIYQYKADKEKAEQARMEGLIAGSQNRLDEFSKFYDSLKQWTADTRSNVQKTIEDSESSKQGTIRNI